MLLSVENEPTKESHHKIYTKRNAFIVIQMNLLAIRNKDRNNPNTLHVYCAKNPRNNKLLDIHRDIVTKRPQKPTHLIPTRVYTHTYTHNSCSVSIFSRFYLIFYNYAVSKFYSILFW